MLNKIMLIDDDISANYIGKITINSANVCKEIVEFTNAMDALSYLERSDNKELPDLIFLDIRMPGIDGWMFLEKFSKMDTIRFTNVKIVVLTVLARDTDKQRALSFNNVIHYMVKPISGTTAKKICFQLEKLNKVENKS